MAARIRSALEQRGVSVSDLARATGVTWPAAKAWTEGTVPSGKNARRIAEFLGMTVDELLGVAAGQEPSRAAWLTFLGTPEGAAMTAEERRQLAVVPWLHHEPTVLTYQMMLVALRTAARA